MTAYTTIGDVRGCCGHAHRTIEAAERCRQCDAEGCREQGGYSDRRVMRSDGAPLDESEMDAIHAARS